MDVSKTTALRVAVACFTAGILTSLGTLAKAQDGNLLVDDATGQAYRQVVREVPRSVVEHRMEPQEQMVYRPETVAQSTPEVRRVYTPVVEYKWRPQVLNRWNFFRDPVVAYRQIPETHWEARDQVINRTTWQTQWVAEKRTVQVPRSYVRNTTEKRIDLEPVGYAVREPASTPASTVAARLRPLPAGTRVVPYPTTASTIPQVASNTVGRATSEQPLRSSNQRGMRTNVLIPSGTPGAPLDTMQSGIGVATVPSYSFRR
ncbi:MAG: hypothetical protein AAFU85_03205 [Planctomycetota bacterium]